MKNTEDVQNEYAEKLGYETFQHLIEDDIDALDWHVSKVQVEYAKHVAENTLRSAAESQSHNEVKSRILSTEIQL